MTVLALVPHGDAGRASSTTEDLQRSLLPVALPSSDELELVGRYVAGSGGPRGDWYDAIPLGAGRIALVVGDVSGAGAQAVAVAAQLRGAVRACARLDLPPAEVLELLDGVLRDLDQDAVASCLYACFDPHSCELRVACAGGPPPLLPLATALDLLVAPPLGTGQPAGEAVVRLAPGTVVALHSDGVVPPPLLEPYDLAALADGLLQGETDDDRAVLLVRVPHDLESRSRTVVVEVPRGRELLFDVRGAVRTAMRSWALLDTVVDTATLVASELATNALVHGSGQVELRLRLTRDRLVLQAADEGHSPPRRRPVGEDDEDGRGLQLVTSLADRWGFRLTGEGKVVWSEIDLA